ncbi:MAG: hypothetical protein OXE57_01315, partial [Alphaproteobacteria bacterium]|nr:hypothetical protein [Alphaproteobacteria bacterium]
DTTLNIETEEFGNMRTTKTGILAAILAVLLGVGLSPDRASAEHSGTAHVFDQISGNGGCKSWARIADSDSDCLSAGWEHRGIPPYWEVHARNYCAGYGSGTLIAHVDVPNEGDEHVHATSSAKHYAGLTTNKPRSVKCCINFSDLCWKDQVEKVKSGTHAGKVRIIQLNSSSWAVSYADVTTHEARFNLCNSDTWTDDTIYCDEDPEGDAHTLPASMQPDPDTAGKSVLRARTCGGSGEPACACGDNDRICDRFDCEEEFDDSSASDSCYISGSGTTGSAWNFRYDETAATCSVERNCLLGSNSRGGIWKRNVTFTGTLADMSELNDCGGVLQTADCSHAAYTSANCKTAFDSSPAADSCTDLSAQSGFGPRGDICYLSATCGGQSVSATMFMPSVDDIRHCSGVFDVSC